MVNFYLQVFHQKLIHIRLKIVHTKFQFTLLSSFSTTPKKLLSSWNTFSSFEKNWMNEMNKWKSNVRKFIFPKFINQMTSNLISRTTIICEIDIWNENWMLELKIYIIAYLIYNNLFMLCTRLPLLNGSIGFGKNFRCRVFIWFVHFEVFRIQKSGF